jgi:hypothetical protein
LRDAFEASRIIEQLSQADGDDVLPETSAFRVNMRVPGGLTAHLLRMPSAKDAIEYRRGFARVLDLPFNKQELTINLGATATFYQKLTQSTESYAGAVPIIGRREGGHRRAGGWVPGGPPIKFLNGE